jgi:hypothetical protein
MGTGDPSLTTFSHLCLAQKNLESSSGLTCHSTCLCCYMSLAGTVLHRSAGRRQMQLWMMALLFWITYSRCSGNLLLLYKIPVQVMARKRDIHVSFHVAQQAQKDKGATVHGGALYSLCQWFHCQTDASQCAL